MNGGGVVKPAGSRVIASEPVGLNLGELMKKQGRSSSRSGNAAKRSTREALSDRIRESVERILVDHDPTIRRPALQIASVSAGLISSEIAVATQLNQRKMSFAYPDIEELCKKFVLSVNESINRELGNPDVTKPIPISSDIIANANLEIDDVSVDWAGPVAGPTILERHYGISRSTLFRWQKRNEVVALRTGGKRFAFPLRQFVDGRPIAGLSEILKHFSEPRAAWIWLISPSSVLGGETPLVKLASADPQEALRAAQQFGLLPVSRTPG